MMAAILNSTILDSAILNKTLTQTNSIWLKLIHSHSTWWCQPSWIQQFCTKLCPKLIHPDATWWCQTSWILPSWIQPFWTKKNSLIYSDSTWWWQPSSILPSWIQLFCTKTLHSYFLTQLDDGSYLEFYHLGFSHCHLGFRHLVIFFQIHSKTLSLLPDSDSN